MDGAARKKRNSSRGGYEGGWKGVLQIKIYSIMELKSKKFLTKRNSISRG
jgi:hypothetical protein